MHRGWVKLWRKKLDSRLSKDVRLWFLFDVLVLRARATPGWVSLKTLTEPVKLERGQLISGRESLHEWIAPAIPWNRPTSKTVWRWLQKLEKMGKVVLESSNRYTIVTIVNYGTYNDVPVEDVQVNVQPVSSRCPAGVQPVSTKKKEKKEENGKNDEKYALSSGDDEIDLADAETRFIERWNSTPGVRKNRGATLTNTRRKTFRARMKDQEWRDSVAPALEKFPLKVSAGGWKPDMDWILRPDSLTKILEGKYDWSAEHGNTGKSVRRRDISRNIGWNPEAPGNLPAGGPDETGSPEPGGDSPPD